MTEQEQRTAAIRARLDLASEEAGDGMEKEAKRAAAQAALNNLNPRTLDEAVAEVSREFNVRVRCFPRWVAEGRMSEFDSKERLARQKYALDILNILVDIVAGAATMQHSTEAEQ